MLFLRGSIDGPFSKCHHSSSVALHVSVDSEGIVNGPVDHVEIIHLNGQWVLLSTMKIAHNTSEFLVVIYIRALYLGCKESNSHLDIRACMFEPE